MARDVDGPTSRSIDRMAWDMESRWYSAPVDQDFESVSLQRTDIVRGSVYMMVFIGNEHRYEHRRGEKRGWGLGYWGMDGECDSRLAGSGTRRKETLNRWNSAPRWWYGRRKYCATEIDSHRLIYRPRSQCNSIQLESSACQNTAFSPTRFIFVRRLLIHRSFTATPSMEYSNYTIKGNGHWHCRGRWYW